MIIHAAAFYLFASFCVFAGLMVIWARNPVHSVLFLILAFFNAAALFVLVGVEFIALILVIVYVGAVAVLFMFVVMMLNINFAELRKDFLEYLPIGSLIGVVLFGELVLLFGGWIPLPTDAAAVTATPLASEVTNTEALGRLLYTDYFYLFQGAGMILLVAMIGAIVLTLRSRPGVRRQSVKEQVSRTTEEAIEVRDIPPRQGI